MVCKRSSLQQLENRGYATDELLAEDRHKSDLELEKQLADQEAVKRTIAVKIIGQRKHRSSLKLLCALLQKEKKLYVRLALSEVIAGFGSSALDYLIPLLGQIGSNQHRKIDPIDLKKRSFPLPRDLAARIIVRIGPEALPALETVLEKECDSRKSEAIDAIGHIAFNFYDLRSESVLIKEYKRNSSNELIQWKLIRALQSFQSREVVSLLEKIIKESRNEIFRQEAQRSLVRISNRFSISFNC